MKYQSVYRRLVIVGMILILMTAQYFAPSPSTAEVKSRPRIALVLSGGGARGAAHVGVLKVLEDLRIPVDFIVGTSMGSFVGGLYAAGISPETLENQFRSIDWLNVFSGRPPRDDVSFRQKQDDNEALFQFEFGVKAKGIILPSELVAGQKLNFLLTSLIPQTIVIKRFDELPIPFRAVAADISTGGPVVLDRGDLAEAIRASMSVPGVLPPVDMDGKVLVDGGIIANLPIGVAKALGVDRIIAVDVSSPLERLKADRSVIGIAAQTLDYLVSKNVAEQLARIGKEDILITPDLSSVRFSDFSKVVTAIEQGETAARKQIEALRALSVSEEEYTAFVKRHRLGIRESLADVTVDAIDVVGVSRVNPKMITHRIKTKPGQSLDADKLLNDLKRIYELGEFQTIKFRHLRKDGSNRLVIDAREKSWGPNYLRFGMGLESNFKGQGDFILLANFRRTQLNRLGAEWKTIATIGDIMSLRTEFYQPLDYSGFWFVAPQIGYSRNETEGPLGEEKVQFLFGQLDFGIQLRNYAELRFGLVKGRVHEKARSISDSSSSRLDIGGFQASFIFDRLDNSNFPRYGTLGALGLFLSRKDLGADDSFNQLELDLVHARSFGPNTLIGFLEYGTGLGSDIPSYNEFSLGGFLNLSGLDRGALRGDTMALLRLIYFRQVGRIPAPFGSGIYLGAGLEAGNVWEDNNELDLGDLRYAGLLFAGLDTVLGPVYLGYGRTDRSEDAYYLFLGRPF